MERKGLLPCFSKVIYQVNMTADRKYDQTVTLSHDLSHDYATFDLSQNGGEMNWKGTSMTPHLLYSATGLPLFYPYSESLINIPQTIKMSFTDSEQTAPPDYAMSVCNLFAQLINHDISILTSSRNVSVGAGGVQGQEQLSQSPVPPPVTLILYVWHIV